MVQLQLPVSERNW